LKTKRSAGGCKGVDHELHVTDGVHNYAVWRRYFAALAPKLFSRRGG
jgi:hypothetical protein